MIYGEFKPPRQPIHNKLAELGLLRGFLKQANHLWKKHPTRQLQSELTKNGYHQEKSTYSSWGISCALDVGPGVLWGVNLYTRQSTVFSVTLLENRQETITLKTMVVCTKTLGVHVNYIYIYIDVCFFKAGPSPPRK